MKFETLFGGRKPLIGMIHTGCMHGEGMLDTARKEIEIYLKHGVYPLIENYSGLAKDCEEVLAWVQETHPNAIYGVNIVGDYGEAFRLAKKYGARFVQIDSVCGHLVPKDDMLFADKLAQIRQEVNVVLLGGVFFKCQPVRSGRTLKEDLLIGMERCDAIVCTGEGTGISTPFKKIEGFKEVVNDFPVIVGAGVTLDTIEETFRMADGAIVGSWFKDGHVDTGHVNEEYVRQMVEKAKFQLSNLN